MKSKRIISACICFLVACSCITAGASVLGSEALEHSRLTIGKGATLEKNVFMSDQSGVGKQSEYFVEYTPGTELVPMIINDDIYGRISASSMAEKLMDDGRYPSMLINSDFFALNTGIPLSHQVVDGEVTVMDPEGMDAIGFNEDGSAFISYLEMSITVSQGQNSVSIGAVNKLRQPYMAYMYTNKFSTTTKAAGDGINVVVGSLSGKVSPGTTIEGIVETVSEDNGEVPLEEGKIVLSTDIKGPAETVNALKSLTPGMTVSITTRAEGDSRWNSAKHILGAWGGRIIKNSVVLDVDESAAPRTAFGIKGDGTLVFYALDGRTTGHSYGARLKTLAKRMAELGCVDAVNLDGGGSTTLGTIYPGKDSFEVVNKPSDGSQRKVATFLALVNTSKPIGIPANLHIYPYSGSYLSGATENFSAYASDKNYYKTDLPSGLTFIAPDGTQSETGEMKITGDGVVNVSATAGSLEGTVALNCYTTPTTIKLTKSGKSTELNFLNLEPGDTVEIDATAYVGNKPLKGDDSCFEWACPEALGTISPEGLFVAGENDSEGTITVRAGDYTRNLKVSVKTPRSFADIKFTESTPGDVTIAFSDIDPKDLSQSNISLKVDGLESDFDILSNKIEVTFDDDKYHKINVTVSNKLGFKTIAGYTTKGREYPNNFADMSDDYWARDFVSYLNHRGIINGTIQDGVAYFNPVNNITRGEFAVMLANLLDIDTEEFREMSSGFDDIEDIPSWCSGHAIALNTLGIISGKQGGGKVVFDAAATLSRAEAATILSRLLPDNVEISDKKFLDSSSIPSWSSDAIAKLTSIGILKGYEDNTVRPLNTITRAEAAKLLYEIY